MRAAAAALGLTSNEGRTRMNVNAIGQSDRSFDRAWCALAVAMLVTMAGCASSPIPTEVPTAQSIAGLTPSGTVKLTEAFVGGAGIGKGVLTFKGKTYPFRLLGSVIGPGSVSKIDVSGDIYKLDDISQFAGPYAQGTGQIGLETSGAGDLWLQNKAGVIMHLTGTQTGVTLSLGRDEIIIEMK
jgi:hypothetical protein